MPDGGFGGDTPEIMLSKLKTIGDTIVGHQINLFASTFVLVKKETVDLPPLYGDLRSLGFWVNVQYGKTRIPAQSLDCAVEYCNYKEGDVTIHSPSVYYSNSEGHAKVTIRGKTPESGAISMAITLTSLVKLKSINKLEVVYNFKMPTIEDWLIILDTCATTEAEIVFNKHTFAEVLQVVVDACMAGRSIEKIFRKSSLTRRAVREAIKGCFPVEVGAHFINVPTYKKKDVPSVVKPALWAFMSKLYKLRYGSEGMEVYEYFDTGNEFFSSVAVTVNGKAVIDEEFKVTGERKKFLEPILKVNGGVWSKQLLATPRLEVVNEVVGLPYDDPYKIVEEHASVLLGISIRSSEMIQLLQYSEDDPEEFQGIFNEYTMNFDNIEMVYYHYIELFKDSDTFQDIFWRAWEDSLISLNETNRIIRSYFPGVAPVVEPFTAYAVFCFLRYGDNSKLEEELPFLIESVNSEYVSGINSDSEEDDYE